MNPRNIKIYTSTETKSLAIGPSIVVISDLHIGAGSLDDFDAGVELEFVSFLGELSRRLAPIHRKRSSRPTLTAAYVGLAA